MTDFEDEFKAPPPAPVPVRDRPTHPKGWEPGFEWDGETGFINTGPLADRPRTWDEFIRDSGLDPEEVEVVGPVNIRGWDSNLGTNLLTGEANVLRMHYYRLNVRCLTRADDLDFPSLFKLARTKKREPKPVVEEPERATFVGFADAQTGKVGSRGGTKELIARTKDTFAQLDDYCKRMKSQVGYWCDVGDLIESFENTPQQAHTNDLSLMRQLEVASDIEFMGLDIMAKRHPKVGVLGIGSNHCRWRRGKDILGTPVDDWGIHTLRQIKKAMALNANYDHVSFMFPKEWDETVAVDACGTIVGLSHGHQVSQINMMPKWWAEQVHGGQPVGHADILLTGHYHTFRVQATGRNPWTGRSKWWISAPTMDNGSDWFRNKAGSDSDPALVVFTVDKNGWANLELLGKPEPQVLDNGFEAKRDL